MSNFVLDLSLPYKLIILQASHIWALSLPAIKGLNQQLTAAMIFWAQKVWQLPELPLLVAMRASFCQDLSSLLSLATNPPNSPTSLIITALLSGWHLVSPDQLLTIVDFQSVDPLPSTSTNYQQLESSWIIAFLRHLCGTWQPCCEGSETELNTDNLPSDSTCSVATGSAKVFL